MTKISEFGFIDVMFGIKIPPVSHDGRTMVEATGLHQHLHVTADFATWISTSIADYGFEEGIEFVRKQTGDGSLSSEYLLSFDMAKALAWHERTEQGRSTVRHLTALEQKLQADAHTNALKQQSEAMAQQFTAMSKQTSEIMARMADLLDSRNDT